MGKAELKIDAELLKEAEAAGVPVELVAERAARAAIRAKADPASDAEKARRWAEENAEAIKAHRERIEEYGIFGEDLRTW